MSSENKTLDLEEARLINFTLTKRESLVNQLLNNGYDKLGTADKVLLMQSLDGIDRTVLSKAKLRQDKDANDAQRNTVDIVADLLKRFKPNTSTERAAMPVLEPNPSVIITPEEKSSHDASLTYNTFMSNTQND